MNFEKEIKKLQERNQKVESDKAWEGSYTRRVLIALITYGLACVFMASISVENFYLNALIPTGGYLLSTLTIPVVKKLWLNLRK
ncbi:MAG: hypothetical protein JXQ74_00185 [Alphaproteobacteria bacterium]|nr:hypothetical protein [Alphaproteobacteria bacterium]